MFKKGILILAIVIISLLAVTAVSASDDINASHTDDGVLEAEMGDEVILEVASHTVNSQNYNEYFNADTGELVSSSVNEGDTIYIDGSFEDSSFVFNKRVNVMGTASNSMKNSLFQFNSGASGSAISSLNIHNDKDYCYGIMLNGTSGCVISGCVIKNTGFNSYTLCLNTGSTYNNVTGNVLKTYDPVDKGTKSLPPIIMGGSDYNYIADNQISCDDANGIYLSEYVAGFFNGGRSNFNVIYNNAIKVNVLPTSWAFGIQIMGDNNRVDSNRITGAYRGISARGSYNTVINNEIINVTGVDFNDLSRMTGGDYAIYAWDHSKVINNTIVNANVQGSAIQIGDNSSVENNIIDVQTGYGIDVEGSNIVIKNNTVVSKSDVGINIEGKRNNVTVEENRIAVQNAGAVLIKKSTRISMPSNVRITGNTLYVEFNRTAIDTRDTPLDEKNITITPNEVVFFKDFQSIADKLLGIKNESVKTVLVASDMKTVYNSGKYLIITLKDAAGNAISGVRLEISLSNGKKLTPTTDKNGKVKVSLSGLKPVRTYTVKITFKANSKYMKSAKTVKVLIKKATPKLKASRKTFKSKAKVKRYTVVLKNNRKKAIKNAKVILKVNGKKYRAKTNGKGKATFKIKKLTKKATFKASVIYNGNKYYNRITKKVAIRCR